mgnify:CR=1 FL=1
MSKAQLIAIASSSGSQFEQEEIFETSNPSLLKANIVLGKPAIQEPIHVET